MNIIVTGGASGLGGAITRALAKDPGNTVYFTYCRSQEMAQRLTTDHPNTVVAKCDFRNNDDVERLVAAIQEYDPDILIHNAYTGDPIKSHFHKNAPEDFLEDFTNNVMPVIRITRAAIEVFRKKKRGKIITILTAYLYNVPPTGSSVYVSGKAYLEKLTKIWAAENARFNISSNSVSPAFLQTDLTAGVDQRLVDNIIETHPLKRLLTVEEVAEAVLYLVRCSPQTNGTDLLLNAAMNIR
jgi:NAD(P)-dependent dehydrogenase (short-subunit alcohol dehydrogenase family)